MAAAGTGGASGGGEKEPRLPEVQMKWKDFMWSLEKLRHKRYDKSMRERDWFRINPLELVLLGSQSLFSSQPAKKDHGTMMLVMESLSEEMRLRPRYWERVLLVYTLTIQAQDTPSVIVQRCVSSMLKLWKILDSFPEFKPSICARAVGEVRLTDVLSHVLERKDGGIGAALCSELQQFVESLKSLEASSLRSSSDGGGAEGECGADLEGMLHDVCSAAGDTLLRVQISLILCSKRQDLASARLSFEQLVATIRKCTSGVSRSKTLFQLLSILQVVMVRLDELGDSQLKDKVSSAQSDVEISGGGEVSKMSSPLEGLFNSLTHSLVKWSEIMTAQSHDQSHDQSHADNVPEKLLSLAHVILSYWPLGQTTTTSGTKGSVALVTEFFQDPIHLLMTYATEGYLTSSPGEFLVELLDYISTLVEQGTPPLTALQTNLPNLFGAVFGIKNHGVSCSLLQYGSLAACSQHQKSLLTEGLKFLSKLFHLFPPIDETRAKENAEKMRCQALAVCSAILDDVLGSLPLEGEVSSTMRGVEPHEGREGGEGGGEEEEGQEEGKVSSTTNEPAGEVQEGGREKGDEEEEGVSSAVEAGGVVKGGVGGGEEDKEREGEREEGVMEEEDAFKLVSDEERVADRKLRLRIYHALLNLACAMVRNGDNISFLFASCLPKLFVSNASRKSVLESKKLSKFFGEEPPTFSSGIPWKVDIKELAVEVLELSTLCVESNASSPFQLCGIVMPKLIKNFDSASVSDEEKLSLTLNVLSITRDALLKGDSIEHFISYGIDLMSQLCPPSASSDALREFISLMASHFMASNQGALLYLIKTACQFMLSSFVEEGDDIRELFRALLLKGKRDEIRGLFKLCKSQFTGEQYRPFRQYLYGYVSGKISHKQCIALCELLVTSMDVVRPVKAVREVVSNVEEEEGGVIREREAVELRVVTKLTSPCLEELDQALATNKFKKDIWESISSKLSRIALFRTLFHEEFHTFSDQTQEELLATFHSKFPGEVLRSEEIMGLLALSATRIEHMQTPRYDSLKVLLSGILRHYLTLGVEPAEGEPLAIRERKLQEHVNSFPRNVEDREKLISRGYSSKLWDQKVCVTVTTDGSLSLEENMRQNLLACFSEFADILKQMAVTHVSVDGSMVKVVDLFSDELTLPELKGRRAIAVRMIDERRGGGSVQGHFYERKAALLAKEDQIEAEFEKMAKAAIKPKTFTMAVNTGFFDCARCCGPKIIGCYAPSGEHCERPLEIGLRCDSAVASVYDDTGQEVENAELLFTEEGAFLFKAYTNGHPYDTSQVWLALFTTLLKEGEEPEGAGPSPSGRSSEGSLVPAVIVPRGYPNQRTWEALRRTRQPEITGSLLTCRPDFSPEWRSYYDLRPERVHIGNDIILHPGFTSSSDETKPVFQRQRSYFTKDLAGIIFEEAMQDLLANDWLKQFRFLGKVLSQYVSVCVAEGKGNTDIISTGFSYDRWRKTYSKAKPPPPVPSTLLPVPKGGAPTKKAVCGHLVSFLDHQVLSWCSSADLRQLCANNHKQLLELKCFLEKAEGIFRQPQLLKQVRGVVKQCLVATPILDLPDALQEEIIHWVFRNEDRVWRYRGGRSGHETLRQFMNFLGRPTPIQHPAVSSSSSFSSLPAPPTAKGTGEELVRHSKEAFAGIAVFANPQLVASEGGSVQWDPASAHVGQMIGYAVGEMVRSDEGEEEEEEEEEGEEGEGERWRPRGSDRCYEVVTAWVHPSYRGLNLSVQMYLTIIQQAPAELLMCDLLEGSLDRVVASSFILRGVAWLGLRRYIQRYRQRSYTVVTQTGVTEQFEQVLISTRPLRWALAVYGTVKWMGSHPKTTVLITTVSLAAAIALPCAFARHFKFL